MVTDDDDDDDVEELALDVLDTSRSVVQCFSNKDRTTATVRLSDPQGLCDLKILLLLRAKVHQMEIELGVHEESALDH